MEYQVVFDIQQSGYHYWYLAVACIGLLVIFGGVYNLMSRQEKPSSYANVTFTILFGMLWFGAWLIVFKHYSELGDALSRGGYEVVEGRVTEYSSYGKDSESFTVGGHGFSYSGYDLTKGFNQTRAKGGPIREGLQVRIAYVDESIVRIEVAK
jgi:hypothetical protein